MMPRTLHTILVLVTSIIAVSAKVKYFWKSVMITRFLVWGIASRAISFVPGAREFIKS